MKYFLTALFLLSLSYNTFAGIDVWTQCTVTDGYEIDSLLLDTTTTGRIYAGTFGGIFISDDYGTTWIYSSITSIGQYARGVVSIAVNPESPNEVYIYIAAGFGVAKSTTYGYGNWTSITNDLSDACAVPELLIDPENIGRMYVGACLSGNTFIYRSDDTGYHWTSSMSGITTDQGLDVLIMHPTQHNILYAGTGGAPGFYVSVNGATTWNSMPFYNEIQSLALDPTDANKIYAGIATAGFAHSFDGGSTWSYCTDTTITGYVPSSIIVNPLNPEILYIGTQYNGVFKSENQGNTWFSIQTGLTEQGIASLAYDTITRTLFAGTVTIDSETHAKGIWMYQDTDLTTAVEDWELYSY